MHQVYSRRLFRTIGILQAVIIALVLITAIIHLQKGITMSMGGFGAPPAGHLPGAPGLHGGQGSAIPGPTILHWIPLPLSTLFILNGIGYLVLVIALYLPSLQRFQPIVRWLLIAYTVVTFVLYFLINGLHFQASGLIDKAVELTLIILLLIEDIHSRKAAAQPRL